MKSVENRNESFKGVVDRLTQRRKEVYELIKSNPNITIQEAGEKLGKPINEVSGRFTELKEVFLIVESENKINGRSGFKNVSYCVLKSELAKELAVVELSKLMDKIDMIRFDSSRCQYGFVVDLLNSEAKKLESKLNRIRRVWTRN